MAHSAATLVAMLVLTSGGATRASEEEVSLHQEEAGRVTRQERPFVFLTDPSTPSARVLTMGYQFGLGSGISADRPLPVNMATANGSHTVGLSYGITSRLAPFSNVTFAEATPGSGKFSTNVQGGIEYQFTRPSAPLRFSLIAAGVHEGASGANGFSALFAASYDVGALKFGGNVRADKMFAEDRDEVDLFALVGVSYRVTDAIRLGAEYVGQDLEDAFTEDAEGGARHAIGPTVAFDLEGGRYQITVGSGFGLTSKSPTALVRAGLAMNF